MSGQVDAIGPLRKMLGEDIKKVDELNSLSRRAFEIAKALTILEPENPISAARKDDLRVMETLRQRVKQFHDDGLDGLTHKYDAIEKVDEPEHPDELHGPETTKVALKRGEWARSQIGKLVHDSQLRTLFLKTNEFMIKCLRFEIANPAAFRIIRDLTGL